MRDKCYEGDGDQCFIFMQLVVVNARKISFCTKMNPKLGNLSKKLRVSLFSLLRAVVSV